MSDYTNKRSTQEDVSPTEKIKRIQSHLNMKIPSYNDQDVAQLRSPSPNSCTAQYARELLEMLERVDHQVEYLQEERERTRIRHEEEVERYRDRIDTLEEEVMYQKALLDVTSEDVDRLEVETVKQKENIKAILEYAHGDAVERQICIEELKDRIIQSQSIISYFTTNRRADDDISSLEASKSFRTHISEDEDGQTTTYKICIEFVSLSVITSD
ncbi:hypothetical protein DFJ58DRAFT_849321 [Suillus subalutaceus]|uniref:uncharacterized protein n=1 Tax=Suillus subalutaceus TaxID=48586 RepID=UPI001B87ADED|nr:uncharacterized protein DFJ58DRAFT_849321 [Suillus subalutaceus]KAG1827851.1 hypothetical protein DFJ58DRAFT_849321 [Suillus subalutaceus]